MFVHKPSRKPKRGNRDMIQMILLIMYKNVFFISCHSTLRIDCNCCYPLLRFFFRCLTGSPQEGRASKASRTEGASDSFLKQIPDCVLLFVLREKGLNAFVVCFQGECTKVLRWHDKTCCFWSNQQSWNNRVDLLECSQAPAHRNWQHKATCCNLGVPHTFWKTEVVCS